MTNRFSNSLNRCLAVLLVVFAFCLGQAQTIDNNPLVKQEILEQVTAILSKNAFVPGVDFSKWPDFLKAEQGLIDASNNDDEFQKAVNLALKKFGASHTVLNAPKTADLRLTGEMVGIGISTRVVPDGLLVTRTVPNAPADRGGIIPGDTIKLIDGKPAKAASAIEGDEGTDVTLTVAHPNKDTEDYILTRRKFSAIRPEELHWVTKDTVLLSVNTFGFSYDRKRVSEFMSEAQTAKHLILDLRGNGGGEIGNLRHLLGYLTPFDKPVGTFIDRSIADDYTKAIHGDIKDLAAIAKWTKKKLRPIVDQNVPIFTGTIAVLIDGQSGSASEIAAQGLRDVLGSKVLGSKSAGAVLVSLYVGATNGFMLQFPLSDYVTIHGVRLEGLGVTPDIVVPDTGLHPTLETDPVVQKALSVLEEKKG